MLLKTPRPSDPRLTGIAVSSGQGQSTAPEKTAMHPIIVGDLVKARIRRAPARVTAPRAFFLMFLVTHSGTGPFT